MGIAPPSLRQALLAAIAVQFIREGIMAIVLLK